MRRMLFGVTLLSILAWPASTLFGFCGFYVSKADTKLFNKASQVVLVRDGLDLDHSFTPPAGPRPS